jgi:hypothetical protein
MDCPNGRQAKEATRDNPMERWKAESGRDQPYNNVGAIFVPGGTLDGGVGRPDLCRQIDALSSLGYWDLDSETKERHEEVSGENV